MNFGGLSSTFVWGVFPPFFLFGLYSFWIGSLFSWISFFLLYFLCVCAYCALVRLVLFRARVVSIEPVGVYYGSTVISSFLLDNDSVALTIIRVFSY